MGQKGWMSELTELDEFFGREPRYPIATINEHISFEMHKQNEILKNLSPQNNLDLESSTSQICGSIESGFSELYTVNQKGFESINNTLDKNTEILSDSLFSIDRNLEQIDASLRWGFSALLSQLTVTNSKLSQIIHLLNIPDSQKQRKYHIEQGFDFLKKSNSNTFFFTKAKEHFEKAIEIEDSDYLSLQQLGIIHLYSKEELNLELAYEYLKKSITYSTADIGFSREIENPSSFQFSFNPSKITATSLMHLARYYYIEEDFVKAFNTSLKSNNTFEIIANQYDLSKYASLTNNQNDSLKFIDKAISSDRYLAVKILTDKDLITQNYIMDFLKNLQIKTTDLAKKHLLELKSMVQSNSIYKTELENIEYLVNKNEYLSSLKSLERIGFELPN